MSLRTRWLAFISIGCCSLLLGCLDPYIPPTSKENVNFLVIDGQINTSDSVAVVKLSRAVKLDDVSSFPDVVNANVTIETETGYYANLTSTSPGVYQVKKYFDPENQYRLKVSIADKEYLSDLITLQSNTEIDSLHWRADSDKLDIFSNTHDLAEGKKYYRYFYEETHEYTSVYSSGYVLQGGIALSRQPSEQVYSCWTTRPSANIVLATTESLSQNVIANQLVLSISKGDRRLWRKFSLLVKQVSLSVEAYQYWTQIQKLSESLGGLFDPLPYSIKGNVFSTDNADEVVLGYFSGGQVTTKRIVIPNSKLPSGFGGSLQTDCIEESISAGNVSSLIGRDVLITRGEPSYPVREYYYSKISCVDCQLEGGTRFEPEFMK